RFHCTVAAWSWRQATLLFLPRPTGRKMFVNVVAIVFMANLRSRRVRIWETQKLSDYRFPRGWHGFVRRRLTFGASPILAERSGWDWRPRGGNGVEQILQEMAPMAKSKPAITLQVEDEAPVSAPTPEQVRAALARLTPDGGPGYIILEGRGDDYAQAAGGEDVFTAEWRECKGKSFRHWKAGRPGKPAKGKVVVPTHGARLTVQPNER